MPGGAQWHPAALGTAWRRLERPAGPCAGARGTGGHGARHGVRGLRNGASLLRGVLRDVQRRMALCGSGLCCDLCFHKCVPLAGA